MAIVEREFLQSSEKRTSSLAVATASFHPGYRLVNQELFDYYRWLGSPIPTASKFFDLSHIEERRHTQPPEAKSVGPQEIVPQMGAWVLAPALAKKGWQTNDLHYLLVTTTFPLETSTAELVWEKTLQHPIGDIPATQLLELYGGCSGFVMLLDYVKNHEEEFEGANLALVATEQLSTRTRTDRDFFLFGDGAAALVGTYGKDFRILGSSTQRFQEKADALKVRLREVPQAKFAKCIDYVSMPPPPPDHPSDVKMDGHAVYEYAIGDDNFRTVLEACEKAGIKIGDFKHALDHQANGRIVDANYRKLEKNGYKGPHYKNIQRYGNTASASVPTLLHEFKQEIKAGEPTLMWAMGAGLVSAAAIVSFGKSTEDQKAFLQAA